jgi:hypothetical protein
MIPHHFSRSQVLGIIMLTVFIFYFFHKDINTQFENIDKYSASHPTDVTYGLWTLMVGMCLIVGAIFLELLVIMPWQERRLKARHEKFKLRTILETLEKGRPLIAQIEAAMQSSSLMMLQQYPRRIYFLGREKCFNIGSAGSRSD